MGRRTIFSCFLFLLLSRTLLAQDLSISGKIFSENNNEPLVYAEVSLKGKNIGTITNTEGAFVLSEQILGQDSLVFTHVAYNTKVLKVSDLLTNNIITLKPKTILLGEIAVNSKSIVSSLEEALNTTRNNIHLPLLFEAYYREFVKENGQYTKFSDGLLEYDIAGSVEKLKTKAKVKQSRANLIKRENDEKIDWGLNSPLDVRKAFDPFILRRLQLIIEDSDQYDFKKNTHIEENGEEQIEIKFTPKADTEERLYQGSVLIDLISKQIISFSYELEQNDKKPPKEINLLLLKAEFREHSSLVKFKQLGTTLLPFYSNTRGEVRFWNKKKIDETFFFLSDLMVTKNIAGYSPIPKKDSYKKKALYQLGNNYETTFWKDQNTIRLTKEEERIIEQLK